MISLLSHPLLLAAVAGMGTTERKLHANYRKPLTPAKAEPYWKLYPPDKNVIEFPFAKTAGTLG